MLYDYKDFVGTCVCDQEPNKSLYDSVYCEVETKMEPNGSPTSSTTKKRKTCVFYKIRKNKMHILYIHMINDLELCISCENDAWIMNIDLQGQFQRYYLITIHFGMGLLL